jgi:hypothetical protein
MLLYDGHSGRECVGREVGCIAACTRLCIYSTYMLHVTNAGAPVPVMTSGWMHRYNMIFGR